MYFQKMEIPLKSEFAIEICKTTTELQNENFYNLE